MNMNYVIISLSLIMFVTSIFFLVKFSKNMEGLMENKSFNGIGLILKKISDLEKIVKDIDKNSKDSVTIKQERNKEKVYENEVEQLNAIGYSNEEIAKKTNRSVREVELILKLKRG